MEVVPRYATYLPRGRLAELVQDADIKTEWHLYRLDLEFQDPSTNSSSIPRSTSRIPTTNPKIDQKYSPKPISCTTTTRSKMKTPTSALFLVSCLALGTHASPVSTQNGAPSTPTTPTTGALPLPTGQDATKLPYINVKPPIALHSAPSFLTVTKRQEQMQPQASAVPTHASQVRDRLRRQDDDTGSSWSTKEDTSSSWNTQVDNSNSWNTQVDTGSSWNTQDTGKQQRREQASETTPTVGQATSPVWVPSPATNSPVAVGVDKRQPPPAAALPARRSGISSRAAPSPTQGTAAGGSWPAQPTAYAYGRV